MITLFVFCAKFSINTKRVSKGERNLNGIPIIIPAYEPDENLPIFCAELRKVTDTEIIIVDDGSGEGYAKIFENVETNYGCIVLRHNANCGKGRALKTAFKYLLDSHNHLIGCITADSDGQHLPCDVLQCAKALKTNENALILGCRDFDLEHIPFKSRVGNKLTKFVCKYLCGINVSDTQTGLRAIPKQFMAELLECQGERFEFEINMLIAARGRYPFVEVKIETVYESKTEHKTHFDPVRDSFKIYSQLLKNFLRFAVASFSSSLLDILLFSLFCMFLKPINSILYITISTVLARIVSSVYNYIINYTYVFKSKNKKNITLAKYFILAAVQMLSSAALTTVCVFLMPVISETLIKVVVDIILFFISYNIQKRFIF